MDNLPPGVTDSMIPGNRPQYIEWEQMIDAIAVFIEGGMERAEYHDNGDIPNLLKELIEEYEADADSEFYAEQGLDIED